MRALSALVILGILFIAVSSSVGLFLFNLGYFDN